MGIDLRIEAKLPEKVSTGLGRLCNQLHEALGDQLISVILYGGLVKGEYSPRTSDVNVLLVLKEVTVEELDKAAAPVQWGMREIGLAVMVVTEIGLHGSTDVFPIKFLDMQQHHHVLWGKDVLANLSIAKDHLRLRCEQEIRNLLLRLRQLYLQRGHRPEFIESTLDSAISSFLKSLGAVLILKTGQAPTAKKEIAETAARELGLDAKPLHDSLALKDGKYKPAAEELQRLYGAFMATVQKAADIVDKL